MTEAELTERVTGVEHDMKHLALRFDQFNLNFDNFKRDVFRKLERPSWIVTTIISSLTFIVGWLATLHFK